MSEREIPAIMELIPAEGEGKLTDSQDIAALMSKWKLHLLNQGLANSFLKKEMEIKQSQFCGLHT